MLESLRTPNLQRTSWLVLTVDWDTLVVFKLCSREFCGSLEADSLVSSAHCQMNLPVSTNLSMQVLEEF